VFSFFISKSYHKIITFVLGIIWFPFYYVYFYQIILLHIVLLVHSKIIARNQHYTVLMLYKCKGTYTYCSSNLKPLTNIYKHTQTYRNIQPLTNIHEHTQMYMGNTVNDYISLQIFDSYSNIFLADGNNCQSVSH